MTTSKAILAGLALIALAIYLHGRPEPATAAVSETGLFLVSAGADGGGYVVNSATGELWRCPSGEASCTRMRRE